MSILSPFQINASSQDGAQFEPAVPVLSVGRMVVVWRTIAWHYDPKQTAAQYEFTYHVLNADGSFAGPDGILSGFAAQSQTNPAITDLSNGNGVVS